MVDYREILRLHSLESGQYSIAARAQSFREKHVWLSFLNSLRIPMQYPTDRRFPESEV